MFATDAPASPPAALSEAALVAAVSSLRLRGFAVIDGFLGHELNGQVAEACLQTTDLRTSPSEDKIKRKIAFVGGGGLCDAEVGKDAWRRHWLAADVLRQRLANHNVAAAKSSAATGLTLSRYEAGAALMRHFDSPKEKQGEFLTFLHFPLSTHGGALRLWPNDGTEPMDLACDADRMLVFDSCLDHQVLELL
eukprot:CAMPEP_0184275128 /NCGR_PEP_ID=MMETSP0977-20130417/46854_1 /TAXON_ID=483370 /ORGANISM="non described non described, Strain CCMP2097" /LENGTH=192 /DNA_ID=CAMNT_0026581015 /DNA_START=82 /DNA_END=657 /DNA_ORIENTATION=-